MTKIYLQDILDYKKNLVADKQDFFASLKGKVEPSKNSDAFKRKISHPGQVNLIAEIKKASPSKGMIRNDFDPVAIAKIYRDHEAAAISVLTEDKYFCGEPGFIKQISEEVEVPILTKDFIIDEGQIYEARHNGASAVLLIVAILDDVNLARLIACSQSLGLDCLVEVHTREEIQRAQDAGAGIFGINNRDLNTFNVDLNTCRELISAIPKDGVIVAESGYACFQEILELKELGTHAVLIGEIFMRQQDIGKKIKEVMYDEN